MASEDSDTYKTIEDRILTLKKETEQYEKLEDTNKIQQIDQFNQLIKEKEVCEEVLNNYKNLLTVEPKKKKVTVCDDKTFNKYMEQVHEIKQKLEQNIPLDELIELYTKFNEAKFQIDAYLNCKKMVIKTI